MLYGTMLHEVFQQAMQVNIWDSDTITSIINKIVSSHVEDLYNVKLSTAQAVEHLQSKMPELQAWAAIFVRAKPGVCDALQDARNFTDILISQTPRSMIAWTKEL